ncbi:MAG: hypothetical protein U0929_13435 [Planctomycetaceae bacterium]
MNRLLCALSILVCFALLISRVEAESPPYKKNLIPSWGDLCLVYGPGTDASMDTNQAMENMVRHWKGRGFTGVYLRTDLTQFPPGSIIRHQANTQSNPTLAVAWHLIDEVLAKNDPHVSLRKAAEQVGFEYWMYHPHIYSEGAPVDVGVPGVGRMIPWSYMRSYHQQHPEVITIDREGNRQWMVPEYAYPGARADKVAEFAHMAKTYHPTGIIASMRSESSQLIPPPDHADQFGFNAPIVEEMQKRYQVDILTDPRFDWKSPQFAPHDPLVEQWRELRGSYITQLYREIREAIRSVDPKVRFAVYLSGEYVGPIMGNAKLDWRTWIDEGIVDVLILPATFEATLDLEGDKKGYLTNVRAGTGLVSCEQVKQHVLNSPHPEIEVIQTGASSYFYTPPPAGADGWQCDAWYDSYHSAWDQRWRQWKQDLADQGFIRFIEQNFDQFPARNSGISGGIGDGRYDPQTRSCPGVWFPLGEGKDDRPFIQSERHRGNGGNALALTGKDITTLHYSSPDRSLPTSQLDLAICNGKAELSFWTYRESDKTSLTVYFSGNSNHERDVALRIAPKTGRVSLAKSDQWTDSEVVVPPRQWTRVTIYVDVDHRTYTASLGSESGPIHEPVPFAPPAERTVVHLGVNLPIKVPSYRIFNKVHFVPGEGCDEPVYLDDVLVKWVPSLPDAPPARETLLDIDFESAAVGTAELGSVNGLRIVPNPQSPDPFGIENTTSYGPGVHCLRARGGGTLVADFQSKLTLESAKMITVDWDLFIRSDQGFPYLLPDPTTRSRHSVMMGIEGTTSGDPVAMIDSAKGMWRIWNGAAYADTDKLVQYDIWNHVQFAINPARRTYRVTVQPIGEVPTLISEGTLNPAVDVGEPLKFVIKPSATEGHISCYDNLKVTRD